LNSMISRGFYYGHVNRIALDCLCS
jgi:hypothetical protein